MRGSIPRGTANCEYRIVVITPSFQVGDDSSILSIRSRGGGNPRICDEHIPTNASLAQQVEHLSCKQDVVGSIPTGGSNGELAQLARALDLHSRGHRFDSDILHK